MKLKKRNRRSRARGNRTLGYAMKKHKGSGNRGGKGMAGTGKRADHRKSWVIKYQYPYFGKQGTTSKSTNKTKEKQNKIINLKEISRRYKSGEINLSEYKILGDGEITEKFTIKARAASESAIKKIEKAGGKVIIVDKKGNERGEKSVEKKAEVKAEKKEDKKVTAKEGKKKAEKKEAKAEK